MTDEPWHMDKRIPVALIFAIFIQTAGAVWWASDINSRLTRTEQDMRGNREQIESIRLSGQVHAVQLGRIEESLSGVRSDITRLLRALEARQ